MLIGSEQAQVIRSAAFHEEKNSRDKQFDRRRYLQNRRGPASDGVHRKFRRQERLSRAIPLIVVPRKIPALGAAIVPTHPNWMSGDLDDQQGAQCLRNPATASKVAEQVQIPDLQPSQIAFSGGG
jgi:hypothetical protein